MNSPTSPYRPGREIARGGIGAVLDAQDQKLGRRVAMKVMLRQRAGEEERQRFLLEARVLGQLEHPNIVPVHDVGSDEQGRLFYTMKLVQGGTLHDVIGKLRHGDPDTLAKYPLNTLLTIFQKICDAVAFAHSRGIIHRDLKPQNIMVGQFGEVLVMDWGLAKILPGSPAAEEAAKALPWRATPSVGTAASSAVATSSPDAPTVSLTPNPAGAGEVAASPPAADQPAHGGEPAVAPGPEATQEGAVMGTPHYMSPEQAEGRISEVDARSDIYSLGAILYSVLTLRPPVEGTDIGELLSRVRRGDIAPPSTFSVGSSTRQSPRRPTGDVVPPRRIVPLPHLPDGRVPAALSAVVMKALTVRREHRYATVAALAADLTAFQNGFATSAENATALTLVRLFLHRHRLLAAALSIGVLLVIGFVAKVISSEQKATANAARATENEQRATASAAEATAEAARATTAEAAAVREKEATRQALAQARLALAEAAYRESDGMAMQAGLHTVPEDLRDSDWRYLLAKSDTSLATLRSRVTGNIRGATPHPRQPGVFAIAGADGWVTLVEARTGARLQEFNVQEKHETSSSFYRLAFSPAGERLAVGRLFKERVAIYDTKDGRKLREWETGDATTERTTLQFSPDGGRLLEVINNKKLNVWDAATGTLRWTRPAVSHSKAAFDPGGQQLLFFSYTGAANRPQLTLLDAASGTVLRELPAPREAVESLAIRADGTRALLAQGNGFVLCVDLRAGRILYETRSNARGLKGVEYTPDGDRFVTLANLAGIRQSVQVWDAETGALLQPLLGGTGAAAGISLHPHSGEIVVFGDITKTWTVARERPAREFRTQAGAANNRFWGTDDALFSTGKSADLELLNLRLPEPHSRPLWTPGAREYRKVSVSADGRFAAVATISAPPRKVQLLRQDGSNIVGVAQFELPDSLNLMELNPAGDRLWTGHAVVDSSTGKLVTKMAWTPQLQAGPAQWLGATQLVQAVRSEIKLPGGASAFEQLLVVWDAGTGQRRLTVTNASSISALRLSADGRTLAEAGADRQVRLRDPATLLVKQQFRAHDGNITALAFHPRQPVLATASEDLTIKLWNLDTGRLLEEFSGPLQSPRDLDFSPTGQRLACLADDRTTRIWEPRSLTAPPAGK